MNRCQKSIAAPGHSFDKRWILCRVAQSIAQPADRGVQAVIKIDERIGGPQAVPYFFARDNLTLPLQKQSENLERLLLQFDPHAIAAQLSGAEIDLEDAKPPSFRRTLPIPSPHDRDI
jgi:hypothetical protein